MRNAVRALKALIVAGAALILVAPAAQANILDAIVVAHRGGATTKFGEGTLESYTESVKYHANILDGDIHWTKDGSDADTVGSIVIIHDSTLDRITNCSGTVSSWLWTSIRDKCYVNVGVESGQPKLIRLKDLIANFAGKSFAIEFKQSTITDAQAKQLWNTIKSANVQLESSYTNLPALNKVKKLDTADSSHKIDYALVDGSSPWPSVATVKSAGSCTPSRPCYFHAGLSISTSQMNTYRNNGISVFLFTGRNRDDYVRMASLNPYGVVVDDVKDFQAWRDDQV